MASAWARFGLLPIPDGLGPGIREDDAAHDAQAINTNAKPRHRIADGIATLAWIIG
jgi:hypothetical protein